jgi:ATP-dependent Zn protease
VPKENKALRELEAKRDAALARVKDHAANHRAILDQRDEFMKESLAREQGSLKAKAKDGAEVVRWQRALDRIMQKVPIEISKDISRREAEAKKLESRNRELGRDLHNATWELEQLHKVSPTDKLASKAALERRVAIAGLLEENKSDLEDARKGLAAAEQIKRDAIESLVKEAEAELAALKESAPVAR